MIFLIGIGGSFGALFRFYIGKWVLKRSTYSFPIGTLGCNVSGSILLGCLLELYLTDSISVSLWGFLGVGFCGAYTTFSTFGFEAYSLLSIKKYGIALLYMTTSVLIGLIGAYVGMEAAAVFL